MLFPLPEPAVHIHLQMFVECLEYGILYAIAMDSKLDTKLPLPLSI